MDQKRTGTIFEHELKLSDIFFLILRRKWIIIVLLITFAIGGYLYTEITYYPIYSATASMIVNTKMNNNTYNSSSSDIPVSNDIYLAQKLVSTYSVIFRSNKVMEYVVEKLDLNITVDVLKYWVSLNSVKDTQVLYLSVTCPYPQLTVDIANTIMEVAPQAMMETVEIGSINVLDKAVLPMYPNPKNTVTNTAIAALIGMILGIGIALLLGLLFNKVKNAKDIEESFGLSTLGEIAHLNHSSTKNGLLSTSIKIPPSFVESFMMLGTIVRHVTSTDKMKKLMITSSLENEGKTLVSVNFALTLVNSGKSVLLIDCDLRKPNIHKTLNISGKDANCLYEVLKPEINIEELNKCIIKMKSGLAVIPFINPPDKQNDIFKLSAFNDVINILSEQYNYIIFDTAPAYSVTDTMNLVSFVDGVILVIKQEQASVNIITDTINNITKVGANIIGCVLNDIRYHNLGSGYENKYKYYYTDKCDSRDYVLSTSSHKLQHAKKYKYKKKDSLSASYPDINISDLIKDKKVIIFGGEENCYKQINEKYPYINTIIETNKNFQPSIFNSADLVLLFTNNISNACFYNVKDYLIKNNITFQYLRNQNIKYLENKLFEIYNANTEVKQAVYVN